MTYNAKILLDSISPTGKRITTFEITFPRIVHAEAKTHRVIRRDDAIEEYFFPGIGMNDEDDLSRNTASSRAIPIKSMIQRILNDTFIPEKWPVNGKGMQPEGFVEDEEIIAYNRSQWLKARDNAIESALNLYNHGGVHKQIANRLLEPFMWQTMICTATEFDNFFKLRTNEDAQYEIRRIADLMYEAYHAWDNYELDSISLSLKSIRPTYEGNWEAVKPQKLELDEWHLPLYNDEVDGKLLARFLVDGKDKLQEEFNGRLDLAIIEFSKRISVARCARVSYLTHDGNRDIEKDLKLFERLRTSGHWSPFEHIATPILKMNYEYKASDSNDKASALILNNSLQKVYENRYMRSGNFIGWRQFRKEFQDENCTHFRKEQ